MKDQGQVREVAPDLISRTIVVERGGVALGFISVTIAEPFAEIEELFIEPAHWGSGLGTRLVGAADALAQSERMAMLRVVANVRALPFYERCGFVAVGTVETSLEPAPVMERQVRVD